MDTKKFIQLVEEKKKRVLEKKEAPLKWEQKLEAAAKAKADAEAKVKKNKRWKISDTENSDDGRKSSKKRSKKQRKHDHSDSSGDNVKVEKKHRYRSRRSLNNDNSDDYDTDSERGRKKHSSKRRASRHYPSSSDYSSISKSSSDFEGSRAPRKGRTNHHCKHHRHQMSSSDDSTLNSDDRKIHGSKHSRRSSSDDLVSDSNDHLKNRNQSGGKLSDDVREEEYGKPRNFKKAAHHHDYSDEREIHGSKHSRRSSSDDLVQDSNDHLKNRNQSGGKLSDDVREEEYGKPRNLKKAAHHHDYQYHDGDDSDLAGIDGKDHYGHESDS